MRFSFYLNPQVPGPEHDTRVLNEVLGQVDLAQRLGFSDVWLTDHQFTGYNVFSDPLTLAAALSQRNRGMRIGFAVAVVPLRHPISFVTQCNLIDQLTGGNFVVGVGAGNSPDEYAGYGLTTDVRHERMREFLAVCEKAWAQDPEGFEYEGKYYSGRVRGRIIPRPVQQPRPHIAYGTSTPETLERVGRQGWSLLLGPQDVSILASRLHYFVKGQREAGLTEQERRKAWHDTGFLRQIYVAAPGEDWRDTIGASIENYLRASAKANTGIDDLSRDDLEKRKEGYLKNWLFAGTAEELIERIRPFVELGVGHMMCWFTFGYTPDHIVRQSMLRFAADVMPALREITPNPDLLERIAASPVGATRPDEPIAS
ncbi:MAG: LLM class flavin-dependent oxidoreductase [Chloroflexota bacterium]|nr:LLM class flavin-dependent oxidoreductase [Dehalococcoidia bacterium]MDW8253419.1 LLM class flavin-dependent oxidoreductase [Chloroflexota bacterium]